MKTTLESTSTCSETSYTSIIGMDDVYAWFNKNKRDLIFRKDRSPYQVYVSEMMLQQTRVQSMLGIYENFMHKFPTLEHLSRASRDEVLQAWSGLGYYKRAVYLHEGAKSLCSDYGGAFPKDYKELQKIIGIGPYTAAAILSICYSLPFSVLDGNVARIYMRLLGLEGTVLESFKPLRNIAQQNLEHSNVSASIHNESLMELGAMICLPLSPKCSICPLQQNCLGYKKYSSNIDKVIPKKKTLNVKKLYLKGYILRNDQGEILLIKENNSRFFKDMYVFPYQWEGETDFSRTSIRIWDNFLDLPQTECRSVGHTFKHVITRYKIQTQTYEVLLSHPPQSSQQKILKGLTELHQNEEDKEMHDTEWLWVNPNNILKYLISSHANKIWSSYQLQLNKV